MYSIDDFVLICSTIQVYVGDELFVGELDSICLVVGTVVSSTHLFQVVAIIVTSPDFRTQVVSIYDIIDSSFVYTMYI